MPHVITAPPLPITYGLPSTSTLLPPSSSAREIATEHGRTIAHEIGSEDGRKIILLCGGANPTPMVYPLAKLLAEQGCRVLFYDYYARGYSDCPIEAPHEKILFTSQLLAVLESSPVGWLGDASEGFSILGYSLGGAVAMAFAAAHHPHARVNEIMLLAPAGLIRDSLPLQDSREPDTYTEAELKEIVRPVIAAELEAAENADRDATQKMNLDNQESLEMSMVMQWQYAQHKGFPFGMLSTLLHAPIREQHDDWRIVAGNEKANPRILVVFGKDDPLIKEREVRPDIETIIAHAKGTGSGGKSLRQEEQFTFLTVAGDHEFPFTKAGVVAQAVTDWLTQSRSSE